MTLYEMLIVLSKHGYANIYINLTDKTLKVGKQKLIDHGNILKNKITIGDDIYEFSGLINVEADINTLYQQYKYSVPSERDTGRHYFKALSASELSDADLVLGSPRLEARIALESYVLLASLTGKLTWSNPRHWFWRGDDKDFIILRDYI